MGLIGPNGAGKTTLMNAVCGFAPLTDGTVTVAGQDVTRSPPQPPGSHMGSSGRSRTSRRSRRSRSTRTSSSARSARVSRAASAAASAAPSCSRVFDLGDWRGCRGVGASARRGAARRDRARGRRSARASCCSTSRPPAWTTPRASTLADTHRRAARRARLRRAARRARHAHHLPCLRAIQVLDYRQVDRRSARRRRSARTTPVIAAYLARRAQRGGESIGMLRLRLTLTRRTTAGSRAVTGSRSRSSEGELVGLVGPQRRRQVHDALDDRRRARAGRGQISFEGQVDRRALARRHPAARHLARAREPPHLRPPDRRREPPDRHVRRE